MLRLTLPSTALMLCVATTLLAAPTPQEKALAEQLFQDGKRLFEEGKVAEGCRKLEASLAIERSAGTLLALAICHEEEGRTSTAYTEFKESLSRAKQMGRADREKTAREHLEALEPRLSMLTIEVAPSARITGLQISLDKVQIADAAWGSAFPVDPGEHTVAATAPGKQTWSSTFKVGPSGDKQIVTVPALSAAPTTSTSSATSSPGDADSTSGSSKRAAGWVLLGTGAALAAVAGGSYFLSDRAARDYRGSCTDFTCDQEAKARVRRWEAISFVTGGLSLVAIGVGVTFVLTSSRTTAARVALTVSAGPAPSFSIVGRF